MSALRVFLCAALLLLPLPASAQAVEFEYSELEIITSSGRHGFRIELAVSQPQQSQGLMFRQAMAADAGMLFVHPRDGMRTMWMRNTFIPLDMLFIRADGSIAHIVERTIPQSLKTISSRQPVKAVLELNAGTVRRLGIKKGDQVAHSSLGNPG